MRVDVEHLKEILAYINLINRTPLDDIQWFKQGVRLNASEAAMNEWNYIGLSNKDFINYLEDDFEQQSN